MSFSKASYILYRDLLYSLVVKAQLNSCVHCKKSLSRETFSIEHLVPWQDSLNPIELFFSLENIGFSHLSCNISKARKYSKRDLTEEQKLEIKRRVQRKWRKDNAEKYSKQRKDKYNRLGT
jgi:hypothetical protein